MEYIIVGTAGHVDHGKTELVRALTGVETDRLKEEKERGISIELGFAPLVLPDGRRLGLVDVPGHERFIKQMLAGVAGIDLVLLVVAADEGVMPQTREHLDIIDLLQVPRGILVLTKCDLVEEDWLVMVEEEVRTAVEGTILSGAPLVRVSALTGRGMDELRQALGEVAGQVPPRTTGDRARLPVDRSFSIVGFGTVATGTLWSGQLRVGESLELLPGHLGTRVRKLEVHGEVVETASAGQRVAVNLPGLELAQVPRGSTLASPDLLEESHRLDVSLRLLETVPKPLAHLARVRLHLATSEVLGRVFLLDREELAGGETALVQLIMEKPVASRRGDRFVIRSYSPLHTIGGGVVIDPQAGKHRRHRPEVMAALEARRRGAPGELVCQVLAGKDANLLTLSELSRQTGLQPEEVSAAARALQGEGQVEYYMAEGTEHLALAEKTAAWLTRVREALAAFHRQYPLRPGLPREELRTRLFSSLPARAFQALLQGWAERELVGVEGNAVFLPDFQVRPDQVQAEWLATLEEKFRQGGFQPPGWNEALAGLPVNPELAGELLHYLLRQGKLVRVSEDVYFHGASVEEAKRLLTEWIGRQGAFTLGEARDLLQSSRKFVLPLLEYLDQIRFTRRVGEKRVLF